jgi:hypothetical protein
MASSPVTNLLNFSTLPGSMTSLYLEATIKVPPIIADFGEKKA